MTDWHPYSHGAQRKAVLWIATVSVVAAFGLGAFLTLLHWAPPWWVDTPAVAGFYGAIHAIYDGYLWRLRGFRLLHGIPDLSGIYTVKIRTSHDGHSSVHEGTAVIVQSWSRIVVRLQTASSTSSSRGGWLVAAPGAGHCLTYVYTCTPRATAAPTLNPHDGTAVVTFSPEKRGEGTYYTGRGRVSFGELIFEPRDAANGERATP